MNGRRFLPVVVMALTLLSLVGAPAAAGEVAVEPRLITPEIDPHPDLAATAKARGWTLDEAGAQQRAADAVGAIATRIATIPSPNASTRRPMLHRREPTSTSSPRSSRMCAALEVAVGPAMEKFLGVTRAVRDAPQRPRPAA